jgi:myo-inositol-1(or 4)-monophosphatase
VDCPILIPCARTVKQPAHRPPSTIGCQTIAVAVIIWLRFRARFQAGCKLGDDYCETAIRAARAAGQVLRDWADRFTVQEKGPANLVTEADFAAQDAIVGCIRSRFTNHGFLGEEGLDDPRPEQPFRWIVDPLDGTSNYVHGFPYYAVSIGLECDGAMILGVIYYPTRDEIFTAERSKGATLNGKTIRTSTV